jgi:predicted Kef-type K+ transport protein
MRDVILPGIVIAVTIVMAKPMVYRWSFNISGEKDYVSKELGIRLGQASEFSLLVAYSALVSGVIDQRSTYLIQTVVILTFVISTYWVINKYPTPISSEASQRRD